VGEARATAGTSFGEGFVKGEYCGGEGVWEITGTWGSMAD